MLRGGHVSGQKQYARPENQVEKKNEQANAPSRALLWDPQATEHLRLLEQIGAVC